LLDSYRRSVSCLGSRPRWDRRDIAWRGFRRVDGAAGLQRLTRQLRRDPRSAHWLVLLRRCRDVVRLCRDMDRALGSGGHRSGIGMLGRRWQRLRRRRRRRSWYKGALRLRSRRRVTDRLPDWRALSLGRRRIGLGTSMGAGSADDTVVTGPGAVAGGGSVMVGVGSVGVGGSSAKAWVQAKPATTTQASSVHGRSPVATLRRRTSPWVLTRSE
jgi:hypothetical protein